MFDYLNSFFYLGSVPGDNVMMDNNTEEHHDMENEEICNSDVNADSMPHLDAEKLYEGSRLTVPMSMLLNISFAMRHNLSKEAFNHLLSLIELHLPPDNQFQGNYIRFKNFLVNSSGPINYHYFCNFCHHYHGSMKMEICELCNRSDISYFLTSSIGDQLESILQGKSLYNLFCLHVTQD